MKVVNKRSYGDAKKKIKEFQEAIKEDKNGINSTDERRRGYRGNE